MTPLPPSVPPCLHGHAHGATFSRLTLVLMRNWDPGDIGRLLGEPDIHIPQDEHSSGSLLGAKDRFCLNRVALAEVADPRVNRRLPPVFQSAHALVHEGSAVFLRYGLRKRVTVAPAASVDEGKEVTVAFPAVGSSRRRAVESVGLAWGGLALVRLAPTPLEARLSSV